MSEHLCHHIERPVARAMRPRLTSTWSDASERREPGQDD